MELIYIRVVAVGQSFEVGHRITIHEGSVDRFNVMG